jgi:DNA-binding HxlR family transcriptional regulator
LRAPGPGQFRAGGQVLSLFVAPLNPLIVKALADGSLRLGELQARVGCAAQTTLRGHLGELIDLGVVAKTERRSMPYAVSYELTAAGREMGSVVGVLEAWLAKGPGSDVRLETEQAKAGVKSLAGGWGTATLRALAEQPRSLTELDNMIADVSYPTLERRLQTMRLTGLIEPLPNGSGKGTLYIPTDWARHAVAPLTAAGRWERTHLPDRTAPVTWVEVEAAFLLALPLVKLPKNAQGECTLAVYTKEDERHITGVRIAVEKGAIVSADTDLTPRSPAFALGSAEDWLDTVISRDLDRLRMDGDKQLVKLLVGGLHDALFGAR